MEASHKQLIYLCNNRPPRALATYDKSFRELQVSVNEDLRFLAQLIVARHSFARAVKRFMWKLA